MEVTFAPVEANEDIRVDRLQLFCEGMSPLFLNCSGSCVPLPTTSVSNISFRSKARSAEVKSVTLNNNTDKPWYLHPVLKGVHWKGDEEVVVPAKGKKDYSVTFCPLVMTASGQTLAGSIFFALPTGEALLYNLEGVSDPPAPKPTVIATCPAKRATIINLPVSEISAPILTKIDSYHSLVPVVVFLGGELAGIGSEIRCLYCP